MPGFPKNVGRKVYGKVFEKNWAISESYDYQYRLNYLWQYVYNALYYEILLISNSLWKYFPKLAYVMDGKKPGIHI